MRLGESQFTQIEAISTGVDEPRHGAGRGRTARGRITEIYGPESGGKSTLAMHVVAEAQKLGGLALYVDAEHAMDTEYARALGVDVDKLYLAQPSNGEEALEIADAMIRSGALDIVVIDSVAALVPKAELEGEMGDGHHGHAGPPHERRRCASSAAIAQQVAKTDLRSSPTSSARRSA